MAVGGDIFQLPAMFHSEHDKFEALGENAYHDWDDEDSVGLEKSVHRNLS